MMHGLWKMFRFNTHGLPYIDGLLGVLRQSSLHLRYMHTMPSQSGNGLEPSSFGTSGASSPGDAKTTFFCQGL